MEARRYQLIKYVKDWGRTHEPTREAVIFLDQSAGGMPDAAKGEFGWRNFDFSEEAEQAAISAGILDPAVAEQLRELGGVLGGTRFTEQELAEQEQIMAEVEERTKSELAELKNVHKGGRANRRTKSLETDARVLAMTAIIQRELGKIAEDVNAKEDADLGAIAGMRKRELSNIDKDWHKRLRGARDEAARIIQGALRVYTARAELLRLIRSSYRKTWDPQAGLFLYTNLISGTTRHTKPAIFGDYDIRATELSRAEEAALADQAAAKLYEMDEQKRARAEQSALSSQPSGRCQI
jgi:hypothetical protein